MSDEIPTDDLGRPLRADVLAQATDHPAAAAALADKERGREAPRQSLIDALDQIAEDHQNRPEVDLKTLSATALRKRAKAAGLDVPSKSTKADLVALLEGSGDESGDDQEGSD